MDPFSKQRVKKQKQKWLEKDSFNLINNAVFGKTMENLKKHRDIKLVTSNERWNYLVSEPNYHTKKWFSENLLAAEMEKKN